MLTVRVNDKLMNYIKIRTKEGIPRYLIQAFELGIEAEDYGKIEGLTTFRGKKIGNAYVFHTNSLQDSLEDAIDHVNMYYYHKK